jgi:hypothetical protein
MMHLDNLDGLEEPGRIRGEPHHQDRPYREVWGDENPCAGVVAELVTDRAESVLGEPRRAYHSVYAVPDAVSDLIHHHVWMCEVHGDLRAPHDQRLNGVIHVHGSDELQVIGSLHGPAHLASDPATSTEDADLRRFSTACHAPDSHTLDRLSRISADRARERGHVLKRPDHGERRRRRQRLGSQLADIVQGHGINPRQHFTHTRELAIDELGFGQP